MTKIKLCGLTRPCDIEIANACMPDYIGFIFARQSKRYISPDHAPRLKQQLARSISAVGVFVDEKPELIADLLRRDTIDVVQLHGREDDAYISKLRTLADRPIIKAFRIESACDILAAAESTADYVLLDSGSGGTGTAFHWGLATHLHRPFFLAGGLSPDNVQTACNLLRPYAVDVSSGVESGGLKDETKMRAFVKAIRSDREG